MYEHLEYGPSLLTALIVCYNVINSSLHADSLSCNLYLIFIDQVVTDYILYCQHHDLIAMDSLVQGLWK